MYQRNFKVVVIDNATKAIVNQRSTFARKQGAIDRAWKMHGLGYAVKVVNRANGQVIAEFPQIVRARPVW